MPESFDTFRFLFEIWENAGLCFAETPTKKKFLGFRVEKRGKSCPFLFPKLLKYSSNELYFKLSGSKEGGGNAARKAFSVLSTSRIWGCGTGKCCPFRSPTFFAIISIWSLQVDNWKQWKFEHWKMLPLFFSQKFETPGKHCPFCFDNFGDDLIERELVTAKKKQEIHPVRSTKL